jgi:hypothetical protein
MSKLEEVCWKLRRKFFPLEVKYGRNDSEQILQERMNNPIFLEKYGLKVFSQFDEDGIIEEIFRRIGEKSKTFVEFGVQDGLESNSHFLLHKGWTGLWLEGSKKHCKQIQKLFAKPISKRQLTVQNYFITAENIDEIIHTYISTLRHSDFAEELDLLSIDVDGNDYWIWKAIECVKPRVIVIEYNSKFPPNFEWIMQYNAKHLWEKDDNIGASLKSFELLGKQKGYNLVGTSVAGSNAFFVRDDLTKNLFATPASSEYLYNPPRWGTRYFSGQMSKKFIG